MTKKGLKREPSAVNSSAKSPIDGRHGRLSPQSDATIHNGGDLSVDQEDSLQKLAHGNKEMVQGVQSLRRLGVEDLDLPLPKIVVVGDQSTGKSSLIEAISEIKVPRGAGTCTRCPLEINLTESTTQVWSCDIYLCIKYAYTGASSTRRGFRKSEGATRNRPLGPWNSQDTHEIHFATLQSKFDVPDALRLAQLAILNPSTDHNEYSISSKSTPSHSLQTKFSPNIIKININGPGLPNLSFYDLPGVISVPDVAEDLFLVDLIRNLVKEYVQTQQSIILLTVPMTDDPANSNASKLVRELKAEERTIGCLTKPDRLQEVESTEQWERILRGEKFQLGFGYFVIKNNPNPAIDHNIARAEETTYFRTSAPWSTTFEDHMSRFGTSNLQTELSQLLTTQIRQCLPQIFYQVHERIASLDAQLRQLPQPPQGNLPAIILGELLKFEQVLHLNFDGARQQQAFLKDCNDLNRSFRDLLADTKPLLTMTSNRQSLPVRHRETPTPGAQTSMDPISLDSDDEMMSQSTPNHSQSIGSKRSWPASSESPRKSSRNLNNSPAQPVSFNVQAKRFTFDDVETFIQNAYTGGLPSSIHPHAVEDMIRQSIAHWQGPLDIYLKRIETLCENMVADRLEETFGHRSGTTFFDQLYTSCEAFLKGQFTEQHAICHRVLSWEFDSPLTLNEEGLRVASDKAKCLLTAFRRKHLANKAIDVQERKSGKFTTGTAREEKVAKFPDAQLELETRGLELQAMSIVKGFYDLASNSFADTICKSVRKELFKNCRDRLSSELTTKFNIHHPDAHQQLAVLLAANPEDEESRARLIREKSTLEEARIFLEALRDDHD